MWDSPGVYRELLYGKHVHMQLHFVLSFWSDSLGSSFSTPKAYLKRSIRNFSLYVNRDCALYVSLAGWVVEPLCEATFCATSEDPLGSPARSCSTYIGGAKSLVAV